MRWAPQLPELANDEHFKETDDVMSGSRVSAEVLLHQSVAQSARASAERAGMLPTEASSIASSDLIPDILARRTGYRSVMVAALQSIGVLDGRRVTKHEV